MGKNFLLAFLLFAVLLAILAFSQQVKLELQLSPSMAEWNETINASGWVRQDGAAWVGNVSVKLEQEEVCLVQTNSEGFYSCNFSAPLELGTYSVKAFALQDSQVVASDEAQLRVRFFYGSEKLFKEVASLEVPGLLQDLSGRVHLVKVFLRVWG